MKTALVAIGCLIFIGGALALLHPGPITLSPSGRPAHSIELSAEKKKTYAFAGLALGGASILAGLGIKKTPRRHH
jgi:tetrahydromethanopterin S-methyltransferase subunit C